MIPDNVRCGVWTYSSVDPVPVPASTKRFWVALRWKATGHEATYVEKTALNRAILITMTASRADVLDQGECDR